MSIKEITAQIDKAAEKLKKLERTLFYTLEDKRQMRDVLFKYAEGLQDGGAAARIFLNVERESDGKR